MRPIIAVYKLEVYGTVRIIAAIGEWTEKRNTVYWPRQYLYETKKSEYYTDLRASAFNSSLSVYGLEYDTNHVEQSHAEYMFYTLKRLNNRLNKINETNGYCTSFGMFVNRLSNILKADIFVDYSSFNETRSNMWDGKWIRLDKRFSVEEINRLADKIKVD